MQSTAISPDEYVKSLPFERQEAVTKLRKEVLKNLPKGFKEEMNYGMIGYVLPHSLYPKGYHCNPQLPLPFISIASQKNFIAIYHMGMYADKNLYDWFIQEYVKNTTSKPDMGKSCMRFKKMETIPYALIGELGGKMSVKDWIALYEETFKIK
ncbi:MAG: DUF1801 domain-containing protein [Ferruginibacter sp.]